MGSKLHFVSQSMEMKDKQLYFLKINGLVVYESAPITDMLQIRDFAEIIPKITGISRQGSSI